MSAPARALPEGRYGGRRRPRSRATTWAMAVCGVLLGVVVAYLAYVNLGSAPIETERTGFENQAGNRMRLSFDVTRKTPEQAVVCIVRVRSLDGGETGRKEVYVPPGAARTSVSTVVVGSAEPVTADVFGCSYQVPEYLSRDQPPTG